MAIKNREEYNNYMREYMLRRYHERRNEAIILLGGVCSFCGTDQDLEFDHIDRASKRGDLAKLWSYSHARFLKELELCQLLCFDCHKEKSRSEAFLEHGEGVAGRSSRINGKRVRCSCDPCRTKYREYMKNY